MKNIAFPENEALLQNTCAVLEKRCAGLGRNIAFLEKLVFRLRRVWYSQEKHICSLEALALLKTN